MKNSHPDLVKRICACGCGQHWFSHPNSKNIYFSRTHEPGFWLQGYKRTVERELKLNLFTQLVRSCCEKGMSNRQIKDEVDRCGYKNRRGENHTLESISVAAARERKKLRQKKTSD